MKKYLIMIGLIGLATAAVAMDLVLNIKLNGRAIEQDAKKSQRVLQHGVLVVDDVDAETNVYSGTLYFLDTRKPTMMKVENRNRRVHFYETQDVAVKILNADGREFGLMVEFDDSVMTGVGRISRSPHGDLRQIEVPAGHGAFIHAGYEDLPPVTTNVTTVAEADENEILTTLEVGKFSARLNKTLTTNAAESNGVWAVEAWLESKYYQVADEDPGKKKGNK